MLNVSLDKVRTILCLGAHADDIEIGCGGTLLRWLAEHRSVHVHWVVLGASGQRAEEAALGAERFLRHAAGKTVAIRGFRDTFFPYVGGQIKEYFQELSRGVSPDLIFTHRREDLHQDHRLVAELTWNAFRDHLILEYEVPKYEGDLGAPNFFVPLKEAICRSKVELIMRTFQTQHARPWFSEETFLAVMRIRGLECNSPSKFAEGLYCRKLVV